MGLFYMLSDKTKAVVKAFGFALLTSVVLTGIGSLLNYLHYNKTGNLLFYRSITGGEYKGQVGFGWISNHTFTMEVYGEAAGKNRSWLDFSATSLIKTEILIFACCFIILLIVFLLINKLKNKSSQNANSLDS